MVAKITVIGDVMLDVYHFCKGRDNPESSAPCYTVERTEYKPGGAGNVAANLACLGSTCELISVLGRDDPALRIEEMIKSRGVIPLFIRDNGRKTVVKERYLSSQDARYHFRVDSEERRDIDEREVDDIIYRARDSSLILISDYDKGVISRGLVNKLKTLGIPIIADIKPVHKPFFKDVFLVKPNVREVREMTGLEDEIEAAKVLQRDLSTNVLLTQGEHGISYFGLNGNRIDVAPSLNKNGVLDVTGAGDSVIATFSHFLNKGRRIGECVWLSQLAGEISVQHPGCYQVSEEELLERLDRY